MFGMHVGEQRYEVSDGWVLTEPRRESERILDRGEGDVAADDRILIPGRVIHVEQAGVGTPFSDCKTTLMFLGIKFATSVGMPIPRLT